MNQNLDDTIERDEIAERRRPFLFQPLPLMSLALGALVLLQAGTVPALHGNWRLTFGVEGIAMFMLGAVLAAQTKRQSSLNERDLFQFYGLKSAAPGDIFQDFKDTDADADSINHMWADASRGSRICASVDKNGQFLRVEFLNSHGSRPSRICIRPKSQNALLKRPQQKHLCFEARVPKGEPRFTKPGIHQSTDADVPQRVKRIAIRVRLVNGCLQHWTTQAAVVEGPSWKHIRLPLDNSWVRFSAEGNPGGPRRPDFSVISAIILEIGAESSEGYGNLDLTNFRVEA